MQRVIYTSSFASVIDGARLEQSGYTLTSDDWNPVTYEEATTADPVVAYRISKKYAELAAWDCIHNESPHFDLVSLCPPFIFGPLVHPVSKISDLNSSSQMIWEVASGTDPLPVARTTYWVDVRDLAFAHTEALLRREVGNRRFIITSPEQFTFQRAADILRQEFDWAKEEVTKGDEGAPIPKRYNVDSDTATKALGLQYRTFKECVLEAMTQIREIQQREKMEKRI